MKLITLTNICKHYGEGSTKIQVLDHLDLTIEKGEFLAILGESGSGKTTLLNILSGLDYADEGEILLNDVNYQSFNDSEMSKFRRQNFGFVFQSYKLLPIFTVYENIVMPIQLDKQRVDKDYINQLLTLTGLEDKRNTYPNELSGGQQQRVAIARAIANKPSVIFADEPTGNLDSKTGEEMLRLLLQGVKEFQHTLVMVTHNDKLARMADRVIYMENGKIRCCDEQQTNRSDFIINSSFTGY